MERLVTAVFDPLDLEAEYRVLEQQLSIGQEGRTDYGSVLAALDTAEVYARRAHKLFIASKLEEKRFLLEREQAESALYRHGVDSSKESGDKGDDRRCEGPVRRALRGRVPSRRGAQNARSSRATTHGEPLLPGGRAEPRTFGPCWRRCVDEGTRGIHPLIPSSPHPLIPQHLREGNREHAPHEMDLEDFLQHSSQSGGGSYLQNWKDPKTGGKGYLDFWLSRRCAFSVALWRHPSYRFDVVKDDHGNEFQVVRYSSILCPEAEDVIKMQGRHSRSSGALVAPYQACPIHRMLEWLFQAVQRGELHWLQEVFRFDAGNGAPKVLHAAGLYGGIKDDLGPEKWAEANAAGIYQKTAFQEKWMAQLSYVFRVVDNDDVGAGVQFDIENSSIGDHVKAEIRKAMMPKSLGPERGHPLKNPYCLHVVSLPEQMEPAKKYSATRLEGVRLTPEIERLITEVDPPDIDQLVAPPAWGAIRATLEHVALIDMPWDEWFPQEAAAADDKQLQQRGRAPDVGRAYALPRRSGGSPLPRARSPSKRRRSSPLKGETRVSPRRRRSGPRPHRPRGRRRRSREGTPPPRPGRPPPSRRRSPSASRAITTSATPRSS